MRSYEDLELSKNRSKHSSNTRRLHYNYSKPKRQMSIIREEDTSQISMSPPNRGAESPVTIRNAPEIRVESAVSSPLNNSPVNGFFTSSSSSTTPFSNPYRVESANFSHSPSSYSPYNGEVRKRISDYPSTYSSISGYQTPYKIDDMKNDHVSSQSSIITPNPSENTIYSHSTILSQPADSSYISSIYKKNIPSLENKVNEFYSPYSYLANTPSYTSEQFSKTSAITKNPIDDVSPSQPASTTSEAARSNLYSNYKIIPKEDESSYWRNNSRYSYLSQKPYEPYSNSSYQSNIPMTNINTSSSYSSNHSRTLEDYAKNLSSIYNLTLSTKEKEKDVEQKYENLDQSKETNHANVYHKNEERVENRVEVKNIENPPLFRHYTSTHQRRPHTINIGYSETQRKEIERANEIIRQQLREENEGSTRRMGITKIEKEHIKEGAVSDVINVYAAGNENNDEYEKFMNRLNGQIESSKNGQGALAGRQLLENNVSATTVTYALPPGNDFKNHGEIVVGNEKLDSGEERKYGSETSLNEKCEVQLTSEIINTESQNMQQTPKENSKCIEIEKISFENAEIENFEKSEKTNVKSEKSDSGEEIKYGSETSLNEKCEVPLTSEIINTESGNSHEELISEEDFKDVEIVEIEETPSEITDVENFENHGETMVGSGKLENEKLNSEEEIKEDGTETSLNEKCDENVQLNIHTSETINTESQNIHETTEDNSKCIESVEIKEISIENVEVEKYLEKNDEEVLDKDVLQTETSNDQDTRIVYYEETDIPLSDIEMFVDTFVSSIFLKIDDTDIKDLNESSSNLSDDFYISDGIRNLSVSAKEFFTPRNSVDLS